MPRRPHARPHPATPLHARRPMPSSSHATAIRPARPVQAAGRPIPMLLLLRASMQSLCHGPGDRRPRVTVSLHEIGREIGIGNEGRVNAVWMLTRPSGRGGERGKGQGQRKRPVHGPIRRPSRRRTSSQTRTWPCPCTSRMMGIVTLWAIAKPLHPKPPSPMSPIQKSLTRTFPHRHPRLSRATTAQKLRAPYRLVGDPVVTTTHHRFLPCLLAAATAMVPHNSPRSALPLARATFACPTSCPRDCAKPANRLRPQILPLTADRLNAGRPWNRVCRAQAAAISMVYPIASPTVSNRPRRPDPRNHVP
ncbi:hypothetical protein BCR44DRAFT_1427681 [Catenaria anguillulae PL171]|uniref:Uncharacterized protein n=1 Tax=Catenaria anguillulae PL171 TaxID=765915 RepID=A0A1Y2HYA4_9FUNG|nr:hypothetical protein BCR44DRAFT_1427681 [Catenaria anguillulae PL171]